MDKKEILNTLKTKFSHLGFSQEALSPVVDMILNQSNGEKEKIDSLIEQYAPVLEQMQIYTDQRSESAYKKGVEKGASQKQEETSKEEQEEAKQKEDPLKASFESLSNNVKVLSDKLAGLEKAKQQEAKMQSIREKAKFYNIPQQALNMLKIEVEADDSQIEKSLQEFAKALNISSLPKGGVPKAMQNNENRQELAKKIATELS